MKVVITTEIEIDDNYVDKRNNQYKRYYKSFGYKSAEEALKKYPLERGIANLIEDCLNHEQEGLLYCNAYVENK